MRQEQKGNLRLWTAILVFGIGVSSIGDFIYLVALNIFVWNETHSAAAVAGMWVVSRIAAFVVGPWAGSFTDRLSHRKQLITVEFIRAAFIAILPLLSNIFSIYLILFFLGTCSVFFNNAFLPYQTLLIPKEHRKRVNSITSMLKYGSFLIGPAIAGVLLANGLTAVSLWLDAASFLISGFTLFLLPNFAVNNVKETEKRNEIDKASHINRVSKYNDKNSAESAQTKKKRAPWSMLQEDWRAAFGFLRLNLLFTVLFSINAFIVIFSLASDSQEVVFAQGPLGLGEFGYGMMVFAAGVGFILGSLLLSLVAKHLKNEWLMGVGQLMSGIGYLIYSCAQGFWGAVIGLLVLGVFGSAATVGFTTYKQQTIPVSQMGRINNVLGPPQQLVSILFVLLGGVIAEAFGVRALMVGMSIPMCLMGMVMTILVFHPRNRMKVMEAKDNGPAV